MKCGFCPDLYCFFYEPRIFCRSNEIPYVAGIICETENFVGCDVSRIEAIFIWFDIGMLIYVDNFERFCIFAVFKLFHMSVSEEKCVIVIIKDVDRDSFVACTDEIFQSHTRN